MMLRGLADACSYLNNTDHMRSSQLGTHAARLEMALDASRNLC